MSEWAPFAQRTLVLLRTPYYTGSARKITLHTMECGSPSQDCWPGYGGGGATPHFSCNPGTGRIRQHIPMSRSGRALRAPVRGQSPNINAGRNIQIEIAGWAKDTHRYSDAWYRQLAAWVEWICNDQGIPKQFPFDFGGVEGYGTGGRYRVSWSRFRDTSGLVGHSNVPYNSHWDPGNLNQARLLSFMGGKPPPPPPPPSKTYTVRRGDTLSGIARKTGCSVAELTRLNGLKDPNEIRAGQVLRLCDSGKPPPPPPPPPGTLTGTVWPDFTTHGRKDSDTVRTIQKRLIQLGHKIPAGATGNFGAQTRAAVFDFQRKRMGASGDGLVGPNTTRALFKGTRVAVKTGFGRSERGWGPRGKTHWVWSGWVFYGNRNSYSVRNLQQRLITLGYSIPAGVTGNYFGQTKRAVEAHQRYMGLRVDGIAGPETLRSLFVEARPHYTIKWGK